MEFSINTPYEEGKGLLAKLGLPEWSAKLEEEAKIGEVFPFNESVEPNGRTKVQIFVSCFPAQFYRFVLDRPSEKDGGGMERVEVKTGSGKLSHYWPMVYTIANNCLDVSPPEQLKTV